MEMIPDLQIEHPPIIHEDGRVEIDCGIRKERNHNMNSQWKTCIFSFGKKNYEGFL
jgi:hypothetical protein